MSSALAPLQHACHAPAQELGRGGAHLQAPNPELLRRFEIAGPRYTSYPTADRFVEAFGPEDYQLWLAKRGTVGASGASALSLYVHLPFCENICYYCACNKVITKHHDRVPEYLRALEHEADLVCASLTGGRRVEQLHFGGGTPTFLSMAELEQLVAMLRRRFDFTTDGDYGIEIDPRTVAVTDMLALARIGFNRISLGVQDFDLAVQKAVNRIQSVEDTLAMIDAARIAGFKSVNIDLIYGLPRQSRESFQHTLTQVLAARPDRIALYHYAHLPERFKPQRRINEAELPSAEEKTGIMLDAIARLGEAGYAYIGMDHFARPDDELARAQREGRLHRNFQGYSTRPDCDLVALGVSAIGKIGPTYVQNVRDLDEYYDALRQNRLPVARGLVLDADDLLRRAVIMALMCQFAVSKEGIASAYMVDFDQYFRRELEELADFEAAGLVEFGDDWLTVTPKGRLLVRAIAMVFDRHLKRNAVARRYSRIV